MSTRSTVNFGYGRPDGDPVAKVYRHSDGYPDAVVPDLRQFFADVRDQCAESMFGFRFNDPSYLAAKYVVWQAGQYARYDIPRSERKDGEYGAVKPGDPRIRPLSFGSVGIVQSDPGDIEHTYWVDCESTPIPTNNGEPDIWHADARDHNWHKVEPGDHATS